MEKNEIVSKVTEILKDRIEEGKEISMNQTLHEDLGLDSLDSVELIMECEKTWNIAITDEVAEKIKTVQDLVDKIDASLNPSAV